MAIFLPSFDKAVRFFFVKLHQSRTSIHSLSNQKSLIALKIPKMELNLSLIDHLNRDT